MESFEALGSLGGGWQALVAWLVALLCTVLAARHGRNIAGLAPPNANALLIELLAELGAADVSSEQVRRAAIADLNQRLSDVSFELGLLPARFTALTRICLASGTALALFGYIGSTGGTALARVLGLVVCAFGGLFGAAIVLTLGRAAKQRAERIREAWDRASREAGRALGTTLAGPSARAEL